jgi:large repetitive protein
MTHCCWTFAVLAAFALSACETHPLNAIEPAPTLGILLRAHYTFDEGTGSKVVDHSGNGHDGVLTGGTWIADGRFGGALRLGGGDYVTVSGFPDAPSSFSVSAWVRSPSTPSDGLETVISTEIVFDGGWELNLDKDAGITAQFAYWDKTKTSGGGRTDAGGYTLADYGGVTAGQWTHLVSIVDDSTHTLSLYVDGTLVSTAADHAILPGAPVLSMGTWWGGKRFLVGDIDDVAIYGRALLPVEVTELGRGSPPDP